MTHVDNTQHTPAILSLCSGMLGIERGLERALGPIRTVAYVEIEAFVIYNLVKQMEKGLLAPAPVWANLKTFHTVAHKFCGKVDILTAGYPCQPFSLAGQRKGTDDPRHLFPHICRIIEAVKPVWCFFENVDDHLSLGFDEVYRSLHALGYATEAGIFSARETGAPHERKRLFILGRYMGNTTNNGHNGSNTQTGRKERGSQQSGLQKFKGTSNLEHTGCMGTKRKFGKFPKPPAAFKTKTQQWKWGWNEPEYSGETMANPNHQRCAELTIAAIATKQNGRGEFTGSTIETKTQWPAAPGQLQYQWEHPQTTKPGMGCTVNGYNFREDILRLLGNGVVEQTAELAFITLMQKF